MLQSNHVPSTGQEVRVERIGVIPKIALLPRCHVFLWTLCDWPSLSSPTGTSYLHMTQWDRSNDTTSNDTLTKYSDYRHQEAYWNSTWATVVLQCSFIHMRLDLLLTDIPERSNNLAGNVEMSKLLHAGTIKSLWQTVVKRPVTHWFCPTAIRLGAVRDSLSVMNELQLGFHYPNNFLRSGLFELFTFIFTKWHSWESAN